MLTWSFDDFKTSIQATMTSPGSDNNYTATIPVTGYGTRLDYYISAEDYFLRNYMMPSDTAFPNSVYIGTDTVKPAIVHTPAEYYLSVIDSVRIEARATDNIQLDTVYIEYKINQGSVNSAGMTHKSGSSYEALLDAGTFALTGEDSLSYRIIAVDNAATPNTKSSPAVGFLTVNFERINSVQTSYATDFHDAAGDFLANGFEVATPEGFSRNGLHTKHPYESPEESGDSIGYTALLRTPVRFDETGMVISFNEVVLVEPGEEGSAFGSASFYDYVIVEGSGDYGKTWFPLTDGYDSRYLDSWEKSYNSLIVGNNSAFAGSEAMLVRHTIFPEVDSHISTGETMVVRFRLFSDPYANGWGWGIEDLYVGPLINSVKELTVTPASIYPNPGNGRFTIRQPDNLISKPIRYSVFNTTGTLIESDYTDSSNETSLDISGYPSGLYLIVLYHQNGIQTLKYYLVK